MNITFGVMTTCDDVNRLIAVTESIHALNIPNVEIIVVGNYDNSERSQYGFGGLRARTALCDGWTPKKKNLTAKLASHDILCLLHDYYVFHPAWYEHWKNFTEMVEWDVATNPQFLITGKRHFTDWVVWDHPTLPRYHSLDHTDWSQTKYQYVSGGYFLCKRQFLIENPFNESLKPGDAEDVEWSLRIRERGRLVCNPLPSVRHNKVHRDANRTGFPFEQPGHKVMHDE